MTHSETLALAETVSDYLRAHYSILYLGTMQRVSPDILTDVLFDLLYASGRTGDE